MTSRTTLLVTVAAVISFGALAPSAATQLPDSTFKLGPLVRAQAAKTTGQSRVIIRAVDRGSLRGVHTAVGKAGGFGGRELRGINARSAVVPNSALRALSHNPLIAQISLDRPVRGTMERTAATIGAVAVRQQYGYDGSGIGVAMIDSGVPRGTRIWPVATGSGSPSSSTS